MSHLAHLLAQKHTLVVAGPGGVGKTTTAAAVAVEGARAGQKVLVLTVDPARRLANSLGLDDLGDREVRVDPALFADAGLELGHGELYAMMLDAKSTFDRVVERHAPTREVRDRIFDSRFYEQGAGALAGSQEYMAMEALYELREERDYDLVVLDTPPTSNALEFLDAPERLRDFVGSGSIRMLQAGMRRAGRMGLGLLRFNNLLSRVMNRFVGAETFLDLLDFIEAFHSMYDGFRERAERVEALLRSEDLSFLLVGSTDPVALDEAFYLRKRLAEREMPFGGLLVNRLLPERGRDESRERLVERLRAVAERAELDEALAEAGAQQLAEAAREATQAYGIRARADRERLSGLREQLPDDAARIWSVPLFERDVHDLGGLAAFGDLIFRGESPNPAPAASGGASG